MRLQQQGVSAVDEAGSEVRGSMRQREQGYMGAMPTYWTQAEDLREAITGIADSSVPGALSFGSEQWGEPSYLGNPQD